MSLMCEPTLFSNLRAVRKLMLVGALFFIGAVQAQQPDTLHLSPADTFVTNIDSNTVPALDFFGPMAVHDSLAYIAGKEEQHKGLPFLSPRASLRLAVLLARVKAYAASMKIFSLSERLRQQPPDSMTIHAVGEVPDSILARFIPYLSRNITDTLLLQNKNRKKTGRPLRLAEITAPFRDEEAGVAYGVLLHIKQPRPGSRKSYALFGNVGHMFITLVKFHDDGSHVSRTFGFYPEKENLLSATPLKPNTASVFKDDEDHSWDELVAKFITRHQFRQVLRKIRQYSRERYHLNKNNCTDFGLSIASISGIAIKDTYGSWPLGKGNDPGDTGQSILEGKVADAAGKGKRGLFVCTIMDDLSKEEYVK
ncbi:hypothetical protein [Filimonas effusa]|uniref:DUF4105 domain-containing protein n=1 Tax=Filimonas effusa TaxID=2508721 RepID=A0A4Q1D3Z4_9BACT|nr:hypothetical protein [Filimonas effusa]RXK83140.1 hypothetical protein ESB13_13550 [Filimonas effusa]